jgi:spermidine synthase
MVRAQQSVSAVKATLALVGFSAVIGQILLMREFIVVFNGNEISLGILFATWLLWTAAGSSLSSGFGLGATNARLVVAALECLLGASLPPTILAVRASRTFFQTVPGELVGPVPMLLASLISLSVFCLIAGALFVTATRMYQQERTVSAGVATSSAYLLEAAGSGFGGIVTSIVLLRFFGSFQIAAILLVVNVCMALVLLFRLSQKQVAGLSLAATLVALPLLGSVAPSLDRRTRARQWHGFNVVGSRDSMYGNLTVIENGELRSIYDNGVILANAPDQSAAEEAVHYALLEHAAPRHVLLIGGGANGSVAEALKHPTVERIDYVELDPALIEMMKQFFPTEAAPLTSDPRVHTHYADGRAYLKSTRDTFDVIILNVPGPQTAQLNRFYTAEFFRAARDHLEPGGLLAFELQSSEETMSPDLMEFLRCIHHTLREVFPYVVTIPGDTIHFFAAMRADVLTDDPQALIARLQDRHLQTQYVREYFIPFRMMPDRMAQVREQLRPIASTPVNRDLSPIAYYFNVVLWTSQFKTGYSDWFRTAAHLSFPKILGAILIPLASIALLLAFVPMRGKRAGMSAAYCVATTGFTLLALQIFLLLAFQAVYGYVYHQLTILVGLCMAGIAFGSWLGVRRIRSSDEAPYRAMAITQFLLAGSLPALIFAVSLLSQIQGRTATWLTAQLVFPFLAAFCGVLGGYQFPIASEIFLKNNDTRSRLGMLYAIDLLGGCAAALLLSTYLIPVFGFWKTAWLGAAINLAPALLAVRVSLQTKVV